MRPTSNPCRLALPLSVACSLVLAACASGKNPPLLGSVRGKPAPVVVATPTPVPPEGRSPMQGSVTVSGSGTSASPSPAVQAANAALEDDGTAVIYFDPDAYLVKDSYKPMLEAHAKRLIADPDLHLRIDGHTDDNGPADYNLELARMRAQMVMKQLVSLGVPPAQLQIVGHGKGRPRAKGLGAQAQAANRRVELTYR
jgi:peptidoglycan-associated lipoprotein